VVMQKRWGEQNSPRGGRPGPPGPPGPAGGGGDGGGVTDHGALTGLTDDDHPQYHDDARGDARYAPLSHVGSGGAAHANVVAGGAAGFMDGADKSKLDGIAAGATVNASDAALRDRSTHTGTQAAGTITGLAAVATSGAKADVGLSNVDNTSDANKPVSTAQAAANTADRARSNHTGTQASSTITMASARLLGRSTAGAGAVEEIQIGANLTLSSGVLAATAGGGSGPTLDYISGLRLSAAGVTITISAGTAYVQAASAAVAYAGGTSTPTLAANTTYHVYLSGAGNIVVATVAPSAPYYGTARSLVTDNWRYLGSVRTNASAQFIPQAADAGHNQVTVALLHNASTDSRIISGGAPVGVADVSMAAFAPITANSGRFRIQNTGTTGLVRVYIWNGSSFVIHTNTQGNPAWELDVACDATPKIRYDVTGDGVANIDLLGYSYTR
jgi:hypothetical protein